MLLEGIGYAINRFYRTLEREIEGNGLSIVEKGITAIEPGFPVIMYAIVKKK